MHPGRMCRFSGVMLLALAQSAIAKDAMPLLHGIFVATGFSCNDPPAAEFWGYYGDRIAPGHGSCKFTNVIKKGKSYRATLRCASVQTMKEDTWKAVFIIRDREHVAMKGDYKLAR
jgi:hypothetical protein